MAREHPRDASMEWEEWAFKEFPMMIYPGAPDPKKPYDAKGKVLPGIIVNSPEEADAALGIDRSEEPAAPAPKAAAARRLVPGPTKDTQRLSNDEDDRKELLEEAEALGVQID